MPLKKTTITLEPALTVTLQGKREVTFFDMDTLVINLNCDEPDKSKRPRIELRRSHNCIDVSIFKYGNTLLKIKEYEVWRLADGSPYKED